MDPVAGFLTFSVLGVCGKSRDHGCHVRGLGLYRQRIGRECILFEFIYVLLESVGYRKYERDADYPDAAGKSREQSPGLLGHEVVQRQLQRGLH